METVSTPKLNNSNIIRSVSSNQREILYNIMQLHNNGEPFDCDITASSLNFYNTSKTDKFNIPEPKYLFDVYPQFDKITKITPFQKLPLEDNSIGSIVIDLPFVISPKTCKSMSEDKKGSQIIAKRFASFYPVAELFENEYWWIKEAFRVLKEDGICVFKMQSTVSGGSQIWSTPFAFMCAQDVGFYVKDEFILTAKSRLISNPKYKKQIHARKYSSTFWVFQKSNKKKVVSNNLFDILDNCKKQNLEGKEWVIK